MRLGTLAGCFTRIEEIVVFSLLMYINMNPMFDVDAFLVGINNETMSIVEKPISYTFKDKFEI